MWTYASTFALSTVACEASQPEDFPLFIRDIALEEGGQTSITVGAIAYAFNSNSQILPQGNVFAVSITGPGGASLIAGTDYSIVRADGIVTALPGGAIAEGETVQIAYSYAEEVIATAGQIYRLTKATE